MDAVLSFSAIELLNYTENFLLLQTSQGEMSEWSNEPAWKAGVLARVPRVRIPLSPPCFNN
jgi:hypothetical protein